MISRILLLGGTQEAIQIGRALSREAGILTVASLAKPGRLPAQMGVPTRIGGWGGREAFIDWLAENQTRAVLDATHPFAARISHRTAEVCRALGLDYIQFLRRPWTPGPDDDWTFLNCEEDAARVIAPCARLYLASGRRGMERFAGLKAEAIFVPVTNPTEGSPPLDEASYISSAHDRSVDALAANMYELGITHVVARNTGGGAGG